MARKTDNGEKGIYDQSCSEVQMMSPLSYDSHVKEIYGKYNFMSMTSFSSRTTLLSRGEKEYMFFLFCQYRASAQRSCFEEVGREKRQVMINNPNSPTQGIPHSGFPPSPPSNPRRNLWVWIIGTVAVVLIVGTIAVFALTRTGANSSSQTSTQATATVASNTPTATSATPTTTSGSTGGSTGSSGGAVIAPSQAITTVSLYYADINAKNYQSAYTRWGSHYRSSTSYQTFSQGFANTQGDSLQLGTATQLSDGTVKVPVTVVATISSTGSLTVNTYQGYYIVGTEGGQIRLLNASLQLTNSNKNSVMRAVSLLEQYYADLNNKDYSNAYSIWGRAYQKSTSSYQFAKGFDNTKSVSININSEGVTLLNDGTVRVPLTITSVNTSGSETVSHPYQGYYIVGMENEVWHLLSANIH